ncbi:DNA ligase (NAD+) [Lachnospiraceae bacterium KHCPX20]|nr:DNA ligase (NAD+) [Lachnospiraceae bacterium KHCPX20]
MSETDINRYQSLVDTLKKASYSYYQNDNPIITDYEYDKLFDEAVALEKKTGYWDPTSPTRKVQGFLLSGLKKVKHSKPMLSAAKTKSMDDIRTFVAGKDFYASAKLDGLTLVVKYDEHGDFVQGLTRGSGEEGEDVTAACHYIKNLPMHINVTSPLELRGECVVRWSEFNRIIQTESEHFSHPRGLAAATIRALTDKYIKNRELDFVLFEVIADGGSDSKLSKLEVCRGLGFTIVPHTGLNPSDEEVMDTINPKTSDYPLDGIIFELDSTSLSVSLGATEHHERCRKALKWEDELYETILRDIEWDTTKSGSVNPVGIIDPVKIDGSIVTKITLHNANFIKEKKLGIGDRVRVYKANMIIPALESSIDESDSYTCPELCPRCGHVLINRNGTLFCPNDSCPGKIVSWIAHWCSKKCANIVGMSEATINFLTSKGWVKSIKDLYHLQEHKTEWCNEQGFGTSSVNNLLAAIEESRKITLDKFICGLNIPLIGSKASKALADFYGYDIRKFKEQTLTMSKKVLKNKSAESYSKWFEKNVTQLFDIADELQFVKPLIVAPTTSPIAHKTFVITGKLAHFANRSSLVDDITAHGGTVASGVTSHVDYLINNDVHSSSSKNIKAKALGVPIINEEVYIAMKDGK